MKITNEADVSLALAVWLLDDNYDYINEPNYISVTSLMKPIRHIVLPSRVPPQERTADVMDYVARSLGHSIHNAIEQAWRSNPQRALALLGYPESVINRIRINPTAEEVRASNSIIPVYLEQRLFREFEGRTIGGKFDFAAEGIIRDFKSTTSYTWLYGDRDEEHQLQMSLYRWLDAAQDIRKITEDYGVIEYIFTDWSKASARSNPKYPQKRVESKRIPLLSLSDTEAWIRSKLDLIDKWKDSPESELPHCTPDELWQSEPKYSYYSDPTKTDGRSTKNFDTLAAANAHRAEKGKGIVITKPGEVKRCGYCAAFDICTQKDQYFNAPI